jgi:hypothetical protein
MPNNSEELARPEAWADRKGRKQLRLHNTTTPMFRWIITLNDRVPSAAKMFRRMPVGRVIATADMTTGAADAQINPGRTDLQAFLAASRTWHDIADRTEMRASL